MDASKSEDGAGQRLTANSADDLQRRRHLLDLQGRCERSCRGEAGRAMEATGQMTSEGSGQWSIGEGKLNLCMTAVISSGNFQMKWPNGMATKVPMPQMKPAATALTTCATATRCRRSADATQHQDDDRPICAYLRRADRGTAIRRCGLAQRADLEGEATLGAERHGGVDLRRHGSDIFRRVSAEQLHERERVLDLRQGAANAGALSGREG